MRHGGGGRDDGIERIIIHIIAQSDDHSAPWHTNIDQDYDNFVYG